MNGYRWSRLAKTHYIHNGMAIPEIYEQHFVVYAESIEEARIEALKSAFRYDMEQVIKDELPEIIFVTDEG